MLVKQVMTTDIITLNDTTTFYEAAKTLLEKHISGAPVVDTEGNLVGVLSEKDLFKALYPTSADFYGSSKKYIIGQDLEENAKNASNKTVGEFMSRRLITATPETDILRVGGLMVATGVHRVPVVDGEKLVGMVSRGDIYRVILKQNYNLYAPNKV
jgi:CBS domain-containing protein